MKLQKLQYIRAGTTHVPCDEGDGMVDILPAVGEDWTSAPREDCYGDGASTSQPAAAAAAPGHQHHGAAGHVGCPSCADRLVSSAHDGVQFPAAAAERIGNLTALHTLGFVNVGAASESAVLRELKKLTQLRKLRLSGINWKNWQDFCCTISGQGYLESLSVRFDEDPTSVAPVFACFSDISEPPKILKTLKVHGEKTYIPPLWIKQLHNLTKTDLDLTLSTQEDIDNLATLPIQHMYRRICIRPIQDGELKFGFWGLLRYDDFFRFNRVVEIDCCSYRLALVFGDWIPRYVEVLVVHSTTQSSLELSGIDRLPRLKEVKLKGSYTDALKQHLQQTLAEIPHHRRPALKLEQPRSS